MIISLPHARGGVSPQRFPPPWFASSSPRPWGCFFFDTAGRWRCSVFPTPVGVFLNLHCPTDHFHCLPHARGGVSWFIRSSHFRRKSSPRPWGCFCLLLSLRARLYVFPTPVGVFLRAENARYNTASLPHARGGVSTPKLIASLSKTSSPRPWGCFFSGGHSQHGWHVFPTPVGVFPCHTQSRRSIHCLPHARGGVS